MLCGLTGIFSLVLGGLILTRPEPLHAHQADPATAAASARLDAVLGGHSSAADALRMPWSGLVVRHTTRAPDQPAPAQFTVVLDGTTGPEIHVGPAGATAAAEADRGQPMVIAVTGNAADDAIDWRDDPTVRLLVSRLCDQLKIDDRRVRWS